MELAFYGGSFTAVPMEVQKGLLEIARPYRENGLIGTIRCSTRPDAISPEILEMLKSYGVQTVELGCQSMDPEVLRLSGRGHSPNDVIISAQMIRSAGLQLIVQMMTGLPGDSEEKDLQTAEELIALEPDGIRIYPTVVLRGTALYDLWERGDYREHTVDEAVRIGSRLIPMFEEKGIPVIRFGLNPSEDLSRGEAAAGAYHPALGELVYSRIMLDRAAEVLQDVEPGSAVVLYVGPGFVSKMSGHHGENRKELVGQFHLQSMKIVQDPNIRDGSVRVDTIANS